MSNMICCEACGNATPSYETVTVTSSDDVPRQLCSHCYNREVASMLGLKGFGDFRLEPISIADCMGAEHKFHLRMFLRGDKVSLEAFELEDDAPTGYQFQILGDVDDDILALVGQMVGRIRRCLDVKYLLQGEGGLQIANQTVCGQIQWDDEADDGRVPMLVIDGQKVPWEQFGRMLMTFEGWQFRMEIVDRSDEV